MQGLGIRRSHNKYRNVAKPYLPYCRKRKRKASRTKMLKQRMIRLLEKLLIQREGTYFFKAFNESIRLKDCIRMQQRLMNMRVRCVAADSIYTNNASRKLCMKYEISTSFVRKEKTAWDKPLRKILRSELSRERAIRLESSFGTQKQHYLLSKIKARNRKTEILWIFFGIHTTNTVLMIDYKKQSSQGSITCSYRNNQKESSGFFRSIMSCLKNCVGKYRINIIKMV